MLIPVVIGVAVLALLGEGIWGYWKFHRKQTAPAQAMVQTPAAPQPVQPATVAPAETVSPPPAANVEQTPPAAEVTPPVAKKPTARKPKKIIVAPPAPEPVAPQPAVVTPTPQPSPPTPSPEEVAKAEAARLAKVPRVVQILCNFSLKEATLIFSAGGQSLFEETLKGKKKKSGFLGIKGSYQGTYTHTFTVPPGASEISIHVVAKDGAVDLTKAITLPQPGGFIPTLAVEIDSDQLSLAWKEPSTAK